MARSKVLLIASVVLTTLPAVAVRAQSTAPVAYVTRSLDGAELRIGAGEPPTIVAVFATWCTTCRGEFDTLDSLMTALAPRGIRVLALSVDEADDAHVRRYTDARHTRVLVARDGSGAVGRTFGTGGVPEAYLVDDKGIIRWHGRGELRASVGGLQRAIALMK